MWRLDLSSHVLFGPDQGHGATDSFFDDTAYHHEVGHWIRWQSTSIGFLSTMLRRAGGITAHNSLAALTAEQRRQLRRATERGPLWSHATGCDAGLAGEAFKFLGVLWLDIDYLDALLFDIRGVAQHRWDVDAATARALTEAWRAADGFRYGAPIAPFPGNDADGWILAEPPSAHPRWLTAYDPNLTLRTIWESASTLDELSVSIMGDDERRATRNQLVNAKLESPRYGYAWHLANKYSPGITPRGFQILAHFAADPPIPFFSQDFQPVIWSEFYPPIRFARACVALDDMPQVARKLNSSQDASESLGVLAEATGLPIADWPEFGHRSKTTLGSHGVPRGLRHVDWAVNDVPGLQQAAVGSLNVIGKASLGLRATFDNATEAYVWPAEAQLMYADKNDRDFLHHLNQATALLTPLLQHVGGITQPAGIEAPPSSSALLSESDCSHYMNSVYTRGVTTTFLTGRDFRSQGFPPGLADEASYRDGVESLTSTDRFEITEWD